MLFTSKLPTTPRINASGCFFNTPRKNWDYSTRTAKDGSSSIQQRCFVRTQNSPSTVVHGCTTVEDGSNGLTVSIFPRFLSTLPDAFIHLWEKCAKFSIKFRTEGLLRIMGVCKYLLVNLYNFLRHRLIIVLQRGCAYFFFEGFAIFSALLFFIQIV